MAATMQRLCKALSDENRLRIAHALTKASLCVCEMCDSLQLPQSTLSNHLGKMRDAGIVEAEKDGTWVYYRLAARYEKPVKKLFEMFEVELPEDTERLEKRLAMRIAGRCHRSYGQL